MTKTRVVALLTAVLIVTLRAADLSGVWTLDLDPDYSGNPNSSACGILQEGSKLTLNCGAGSPPIVGEVVDHAVTWRHIGPKNEFTATFRGTVDKEEKTITGTWHMEDDHPRDGKFAMKKLSSK
jgi:hypothetical protein